MIGFPVSREQYHFLHPQLRDDESKKMEFPAEYMFKDVPERPDENEFDPVDVTLAEMDKHGVALGLVGLGTDATTRALKEHPDRFVASVEIDPNEISKAVRRIRTAYDEHGIKAV